MPETAEEEEIREAREADIYYRLKNKGPAYRSKSSEPSISLGGEYYSLRWIMCYAKLRWAGVACMYSASVYANEQLFELGEEHQVERRSLDARLLWMAHQERRRCKRPRKEAA